MREDEKHRQCPFSKHKLPIYTHVISPAVYFVEIRFRLIAFWGTIHKTLILAKIMLGSYKSCDVGTIVFERVTLYVANWFPNFSLFLLFFFYVGNILNGHFYWLLYVLAQWLRVRLPLIHVIVHYMSSFQCLFGQTNNLPKEL